ncbi:MULTISPECIES: YfhO family protein [unclassified Apibacter]|uniref:YfhO family protein n=1 Tax=unclassified Apibacter TaxID=2630820 RepID=UPI00132903FC|nr:MULTISPECIES: YfhO family protein [unclassified Apibacter]MCX8676446.1 YfhO family protein [Apibacter sp. B3919]MXO23910.1 YfhO family protein [Apibacter sp. B3924]MXO26413.1 YfhO family protein [Apibacter sp. B3813]MXO28365.1 YfhO family protein [Apibacter sp. B3913]MXO30319.1 YfhO family protein [Apibacter sp. B3912]
MKKNSYFLPVVGCLLFFVILSFMYFSPLLSGKYISQPDIIHYKGGAHELEDYRSIHGEDTYWSNSMFGGMPTYQMGANYPSDIIKSIDRLLRTFPTPASYLFLLLSGFYLLGMVWLKNWKYALLGSIMFSFSTYFFIIIGAGHNAKIHTIAYFAPFIAGVYLLYQKKYVTGFILTTLLLSLQIAANHPQMTYYLFLALGIFGLIELIHSFKTKTLKTFGISSGFFLLAILLALGMNSTRLLSTYEYSKETTRGKSELTISKNNVSSNQGLDTDYITHWSYGILETANLFVPNFMGGGNNEKGFKTSNLESSLQENIRSQEEYTQFQRAFNGSYWGEQPGTVGPAYQGSVVIFLAFLALFYYKGRYKWWLVAATVLSFFLAWGKNFGIFTDFMIQYFPLYNKFRAVSSALVIAEFTIPLLALLGTYSYFMDESLTQVYKTKILYISSGFILVILLLLYVLGLQIFSFHTSLEGNAIKSEILEAIRKDRFALFQSDILRTFFFVLVCSVLLWAAQIKSFKSSYAVLAIAALSLVDLWGVDKRYLNDDNFVDKQFYKNPFPTQVTESQLEKAQTDPTLARIVNAAPINHALDIIKQNDHAHYRVFNLLLSPFNETNTSYFHQSIGGYHGAKLRRYQDLIDFYLSDSLNLPILDMLNTKYIITADSIIRPIPNPNNNGNAWFVNEIVFANNADEELLGLGKIDNKRKAVINSKYKKDLTIQSSSDSLSSIELKEYLPNNLTYVSNSKEEKLGVFSEIYYPHGWKASIDGKEVPIYRADYTLRALKIPAGKHTINFSFNPPVIQKGKYITLGTCLLFVIISSILLIYDYKKRSKSSEISKPL